MLHVISCVYLLGKLKIGDLRDVLNEVWAARSKWVDVGIQLSLVKTDLDAIKETHGDNVGNCFTEMLTLWLKQVDPPPTWSSLVSALNRPAVGYQGLAEEIATKHIIKEDSSGVSAEVAKLSFPHIDKIAPDEHTREELLGRLRAESKAIIKEYNVLENQFFDTLEDEDFSVRRLERYLRRYASQEQKLKTIEDVEDVITERSSFYDYQLLEYMIELAGSERDKEKLQEYQKKFMTYAKRRVYECPSIIGGTSPNESSFKSKLCVKLDSTYDDCTLEQLKDFQYKLCAILQLSICVCKLNLIETGCLFLTFMVHDTLEPTLPLSTEQKKCLQELGVLHLRYGCYEIESECSVHVCLLKSIIMHNILLFW